MIAQSKCGLCITHTLEDAHSFISSLEHRGRDATGIAAIGNDRIDVVKWIGTTRNFEIRDLYKLLPGSQYHTFLAHNRYKTQGSLESLLKEAHPHVIGGTIVDNGSHMVILDCEMVAVHNGQVDPMFYADIPKEVLATNCDTEALLHVYRQIGPREFLKRIPGSYVFAVADKRQKDVVLLRDRHGIKPAYLGMKDGKDGAASENVAFSDNHGSYITDIMPGWMYFFSPEGTHHKEKVVGMQQQHCFFEWNYIGNPSSVINRVHVHTARELLGERLAEEFRPDIDFVTFVPRCPEIAAYGYANKTGIPCVPVFYKMKGERSFLGPTPEERAKSIKANLHLIPQEKLPLVLRGKRGLVIDDSLIRGNVALAAKELLLGAGLAKVYFASYTPPIGIVGEDGVARGCMYGVDMPPTDNFIARDRTIDQISAELGLPVHYLSVEGMHDVFRQLKMPQGHMCTFCIGGKKPF